MKFGPVLILFLSSVVCAFAREDLAAGVQRARLIVERHLTGVKLNSVYGTPAFDVKGRRIADVFLNFTGKARDGSPMLFSLTLTPGESLDGENDADNPRPDEYEHHLKPGIALEAWVQPEEALATALAQHAGHEPTTDRISLAYYTEKRSGRVVLVYYWQQDQMIHDVVIDARYGEVLEVNHTPWPDR